MINNIYEICVSIILIIVTLRIIIPVVYSIICMVRDFKIKEKNNEW